MTLGVVAFCQDFGFEGFRGLGFRILGFWV